MSKVFSEKTNQFSLTWAHWASRSTSFTGAWWRTLWNCNGSSSRSILQRRYILPEWFCWIVSTEYIQLAAHLVTLQTLHSPKTHCLHGEQIVLQYHNDLPAISCDRLALAGVQFATWRPVWPHNLWSAFRFDLIFFIQFTISLLSGAPERFWNALPCDLRFMADAGGRDCWLSDYYGGHRWHRFAAS